MRRRFDGFHAVPASVSKTCLVRFDNNKYSVAASAVGRPVDVHAYADRVVIRRRADRCRASALVRPWRDGLRTPGTTCRCSPASPAPCATARPSRTGCCRLRWSVCGASSPAVDDGNRQMVDPLRLDSLIPRMISSAADAQPAAGSHPILAAVLTDGLPAVEAACAEAIAHGVHLRQRRSQHPRPPTRSRSAGHDLHTGCSDTAPRRPSPIVPVTTTSGGPSDGTNPALRPHRESSSSTV